MRNWISPAQLGALVGVSTNTVRKHIKDGRVVAVQVGNVYRIPMEEYGRIKAGGYPPKPIEAELQPNIIKDPDDV